MSKSNNYKNKSSKPSLAQKVDYTMVMGKSLPKCEKEEMHLMYWILCDESNRTVHKVFPALSWKMFFNNQCRMLAKFFEEKVEQLERTYWEVTIPFMDSKLKEIAITFFHSSNVNAYPINSVIEAAVDNIRQTYYQRETIKVLNNKLYQAYEPQLGNFDNFLDETEQSIYQVKKRATSHREGDLDECRFFPEAEYEDETPLVVRENDYGEIKPMIFPNSIAAITGDRGSRKTTFLQALVVAALNPNHKVLGFEFLEPQRVLWIDTEQPKNRARRGMKRIENMCRSINPNLAHRNFMLDGNFEGYFFRDKTPQERLVDTIQAIDKHKPSLLILDGLVDLLEDFNDVKEASALVNKLMHISDSKNVTIFTVLHIAKSTQRMNGHLGSILDRKIDFCVKVDKDAEDHNYSHIIQTKSREEFFRRFRIYQDKQGFPREEGYQEDFALPSSYHDDFDQSALDSFGSQSDVISQSSNKPVLPF